MQIIYHKIKNSLSDRSISSENHIAAIYLILIAIIALLFLLELYTIKNMPGRLSVFGWLILCLIFEIWIARYTRKKARLVYHIQNRTMLEIICWYGYFVFILISTSLLMATIYQVLVYLYNIDPYVYSKNDMLVTQQNTLLAMKNTTHFVLTVFRNTFYFLLLIYFSSIMNPLLPDRLQRVDVPIKSKFERLTKKVFYIVLLSFVSWVLINTQRNQLHIFELIQSLILLIKPNFVLMILGFNNGSNEIIISDKIKAKFQGLKIFATVFLIIWATAVELIPKPSINRVYIIGGLCIISMLAILVYSHYAHTKLKDYFESWIVSPNNKNQDSDSVKISKKKHDDEV
ncbi:hypothetical protein [Latilactobacillus sakei]|uniref:hypothetical protein n=1 Tax=Latilactobacillus sakei TaxID=1599 RepID=UPI00202E361B|nr:hypothetical protein [Latilactobacillus sakei]MCM1635800.1 hypothetical protein [Latilactobacillus sakei]